MIDTTLSGLAERICEVICNRFGVSPTEGYEIADEILDGLEERGQDMTEKERVSCTNTIKALRRAVFNANGMLYAIDTENCKKIIAMLEQPEPCDDAVSRQAALDCVTYDVEYTMECIKALPPVQPERKKGRWILVTNGRGGHECNRCHEYAPSYQSGVEHLSKFCPNCGADMRDAERGTDEEEQRKDSEI